MIAEITDWIEEKLETCTDSEQPLLLELMSFIIAELQKEVTEMKEAQDD